MKEFMRKHLWPASLVAALAVVGLLAAFVALAGPDRGAVEAQDGGICLTASGATLASLIQAGICSAATPGSGAGTATPGTGGPSQPGTPGSPGGTQPTPVPTADPDSVCASATPSQLAALIAAGVCREPTPTPTITPTPVPTAMPEPTATPVPPTPTPVPVRGDSIVKDSTSASAGIKITLTIGNLPMDMRAGSSVVLYLEDDFDVPASIARDAVYFTVTNVANRERGAATGDGGRSYATDPIEIDEDDYYGGDDDTSIRVYLPDFNTGDNFDGFNGPNADETLTLVIAEEAGIKNPSEAHDNENDYANGYKAGYDVLAVGAGVKGTPPAANNVDDLIVQAKISLSDEDNTRGYELTVTGSGFNNGTSAAVHVLADDSVTEAMLDDGAMEAALCSRILQTGHRAGIATVDSGDKASVAFDVTVPIFEPGNVNYLCMVDGEGRASVYDVETFKLEPSIRVSPTSASVGDTISVFAQDFPTPGAAFAELKIANRVVWSPTVTTVIPDELPGIGSDGSATLTFDMPGSVSGNALEGTVRIDAKWGAVSEDAKITLTGSSLRLSAGEARANESVTIQGEGFGTSSANEIAPANITIDGVQLLVDDDSLEGGVVEVSSAGQFVATVYLWEDDRESDSNPALTAGTHTIRVRDNDGFYGTATISIKEPSMTILPEVLGPRDYLTVTGTDWPVDNADSSAPTGSVEVVVENRTYTVIPDATGRFTVEHRVSRDIAIPTTESVKATYKIGQTDYFVKTASFAVPAATIEVSPAEGQPGDEVTLTVTGMPVYAEVEEITIGGAKVGTAQDFRTDRDGNVTADGLAIPGLDPGTYSVVLKVGSGSNQTVAIGSITVLTEVVPGAVAELPGALSDLGDNLEAVFYFDNVSKDWSFYDPRDEFADLNTLDGMVAGQAYWILVGTAVDEVVLNNKTRNLSCSNGDCWNLVVW